MENDRVSLKRKPESEPLSLAESEAIKRHQFEAAELQPTTVIELVPTTLVKPTDDGYEDQAQQFIELSNVAFDHHNFINVENIFHHQQPFHIHTNSVPEFATGQLWNGTDLIVLESCPPPPPPPPLPVAYQPKPFLSPPQPKKLPQLNDKGAVFSEFFLGENLIFFCI